MFKINQRFHLSDDFESNKYRKQKKYNIIIALINIVNILVVYSSVSFSSSLMPLLLLNELND
jgi:hypothetical protein